MSRGGLGLVVWLSAAILLSCEAHGNLYPPCPGPDLTHLGPEGSVVPCDGDADWEPCPGECVPIFIDRDGWSDPSLIWFGTPGDVVPRCPGMAPVQGDAPAFAGLNPNHECGTCGCESPTGSCEVPTAFTAYAGPLCPASAMQTPFDAQATWDGTCTTWNAISPGKMCPPLSNVPCVQSLWIGAPAIVNETGCAQAVDPTPAKLKSPTWNIVMHACGGKRLGDCRDSTKQCEARAEDGRKHCVIHTGLNDDNGNELTCPPGWSDKKIFYQTFDDTRDCSPCECGSPVGSKCTAQITVYPNNTCSGVPLLDVTVDAAGCHNPMDGAALASKHATAVYTPGTCEPSGGEPTGTAVPADPVTVCCVP